MLPFIIRLSVLLNFFEEWCSAEHLLHELRNMQMNRDFCTSRRKLKAHTQHMQNVMWPVQRKKPQWTLTEQFYHSRGTRNSFMEDIKPKIKVQNGWPKTEKIFFFLSRICSLERMDWGKIRQVESFQVHLNSSSAIQLVCRQVVAFNFFKK